jgi:RNA polymerase sigma factor (sigma-70 family)
MSTELSDTGSRVAATPPSSPKYIILDTNVLLRLLILDFGTQQAIGITTLAKKSNSLIVLAPGQEDEFWRNASEVLSEHEKRWTQIARDTRKAVGDLLNNLKAARALGILTDEQEQVLTDLGPAKQHLEKIKEREVKWSDFESFADSNFQILRAMTKEAGLDGDLIRQRADHRVAMSNPPCREKKSRPLGDCLVWEVVLSLLERKSGECWFATTDADFSDHSNVHVLNRQLDREVRNTGGLIQFLHEDRSLGLSPGSRFRVLSQLADTIPQHVTEQMRRDIDALSTISPVLSWIQLEEALGRLSYRQREILKLRLGLRDGFEYTQAEVAQIFKVSQPRISQLEKSAADKLREILSGES